MDKLKVGFLSYLSFFAGVFAFILMLPFSFGVGYFGAQSLSKAYLSSLQANGHISLSMEAILRIANWSGLAGAVFFGYLCAFWVIHSFPDPPPRFRRTRKKESK